MKYLKLFTIFEYHHPARRHRRRRHPVLKSEGIVYLKPNFHWEWQEAERYINHDDPSKRINWNKEQWLEKAKKGRVMKFSQMNFIENCDASYCVSHGCSIEELVETYEALDSKKKARFEKALTKKEIELPIVMEYIDGTYEMVAGNTRTAGLIANGYDPSIWVFSLKEDSKPKALEPQY